MNDLKIDDDGRRFLNMELPEADVVFYPEFFAASEADGLLSQLVETTAWRQDSMKIYGKATPLPRLTAWHGDPGARYVYSGIVNDPLPWTAALTEIKKAVDAVSGVEFNGVLLNRYRTGKDSMGWHSDDEQEFGPNPVIASVSFGGTRNFQLRHKTPKGPEGERRTDARQPAHHAERNAGKLAAPDSEDSQAGERAGESHVPAYRQSRWVSSIGTRSTTTQFPQSSQGSLIKTCKC